LAFCLAASVLAGCSDSNGDFFSGHQAGTNDPKTISDIGDVRIRVARVSAAQNFKIPKTYAFHFSWTPEAYADRQAAKGLRGATEQDWARYERFLLQSGMKQKAAANIVKYQRKKANRTKFKPVIGSNGQVAFCNDTWGGKYGCSIGLNLSKTQQRRLAQSVLDRTEAGCKIGTIDPPQLSALRPGIKSGKLSVVATITCSG